MKEGQSIKLLKVRCPTCKLSLLAKPGVKFCPACRGPLAKGQKI